MSQLFANAEAWLAALDPAAPAAALVLFVFSTIYAIRRWLPGVWKVVEATVPFASSLDAGPVFDAVWKTWQALPGALLGAGVAALSAGLSVKTALWGVGSGALASLAHELMAAYRGQVGGPPKPPSASYKPERSQVFPGSDKPSDPPPAAAMRSLAIGVLALCIGLGGCAWFQSTAWPVVKDCAPTAAALLSQVETILLAGGDYDAKLQDLAQQLGADGKTFVACAIEQFLSGATPATAEQSAAKARGKAFLVAHKVEQ